MGTSDADEITAALMKASMAGTQRLHEVACETLMVARVGPNCDPRRLGTGLRYRARPIIVRPLRRVVPRVLVEGKRIVYRSDAEWGLNLLLGIASVRIAELGIVAGKADRYRLAAHLAMPDPRSSLAGDLELQRFVPEWLILAHHRARASLAAASALRLVVGR